MVLDSGLLIQMSYCRTLSARYYKDGSEILIPQEGRNPRRLTPRNVQGCKDSRIHSGFRFLIPEPYKQFGNSVAVPLMEILAKEVTKSLNQEKPVVNAGKV